MLGILILMALSYILLHFTNKQLSLSTLLHTSKTFTTLAIGLAWPIIYFCSYELLLGWLVANPYVLNSTFTLSQGIATVLYILRSVIYEELIFRGAIFLAVWKKLGSRPAILISSSCFGVYHWFAWQAFGSPMQMATIFLMTGSVGMVYAYAFVRTKGMYLPIALHFGANFTNMLIFSKDKHIGLQLLFKRFANEPVVPHPMIGLAMIALHFTGYQIFTFLLTRWLTYRKQP
ncbi:CPBP family intramembrane glutamic endopeptidase [Pedobacter xixiisoli]|uniref:CAAX prenyl protease 2/Lysostaphin resistance protein A-like domain-containing protein n=1 Tax=Pedobacter xixiisoli TaxID=1476464 RepID=A0A285ZWC5_9SPHI|nr:CPBP family intramembrane glutamic endopeptidase [Pedobacter xixiisoli]SOD13930.1 hypothetical protein SAMN06297358_1314 [Pedobacter xixiisoli]